MKAMALRPGDQIKYKPHDAPKRMGLIFAVVETEINFDYWILWDDLLLCKTDLLFELNNACIEIIKNEIDI